MASRHRLVLAGYAHQDFRLASKNPKQRMWFLLKHYAKLMRQVPTIRVYTDNRRVKPLDLDTKSDFFMGDILRLFERCSCVRICAVSNKTWAELAGVSDKL